jgi:hypothetical protein
MVRFFCSCSKDHCSTMKKTIFLFLIFPLCTLAQDKIVSPKVGLKWGPAGLTFGSFNLLGEYNFGKNSLTAKLGVPAKTHHSFTYDGNDAKFSLKATSFMAGYRTYLSKKHMKGLYFEPFFKYVHHSSEGIGNSLLGGEPVVLNFTNDYNGVGIGVQLGVQFLIKKRAIIDFYFLGPEVNSARNNFYAVETSRTIPWTTIQADEAEHDIRDFIDKFPFVRKRTNVMVDKINHGVRADFKGMIPGYRIGASLGIAF